MLHRILGRGKLVIRKKGSAETHKGGNLTGDKRGVLSGKSGECLIDILGERRTFIADAVAMIRDRRENFLNPARGREGGRDRIKRGKKIGEVGKNSKEGG